jgi:hypothetical protein
MQPATNDHNPDHHVTAPLRLRTVISWHRADDQRVKQAFAAALGVRSLLENGIQRDPQ